MAEKNYTPVLIKVPSELHYEVRRRTDVERLSKNDNSIKIEDLYLKFLKLGLQKDKSYIKTQ